MSAPIKVITLLGGLIVASSALAQTYTRDDVAQLQQDCYRQRAEHIAPLKQEEVQRYPGKDSYSP